MDDYLLTFWKALRRVVKHIKIYGGEKHSNCGRRQNRVHLVVITEVSVHILWHFWFTARTERNETPEFVRNACVIWRRRRPWAFPLPNKQSELLAQQSIDITRTSLYGLEISWWLIFFLTQTCNCVSWKLIIRTGECSSRSRCYCSLTVSVKCRARIFTAGMTNFQTMDWKWTFQQKKGDFIGTDFKPFFF